MHGHGLDDVRVVEVKMVLKVSGFKEKPEKGIGLEAAWGKTKNDLE